jgi:hypothetical protein
MFVRASVHKPLIVKLKRAHSKLISMEKRKRASFSTCVTKFTETMAEDIKEVETIVKEIQANDEPGAVEDDSYFIDPDVL